MCVRYRTDTMDVNNYLVGWPAVVGIMGPAGTCFVATLRVRKMDVGWIVVWGLVSWTLGFLFVLALMRMAGDQDRAARHEEKLMDPFSDVSITQTGNG